ncbi:hypothetical protein FWD07_02540 [Candidatus Saccharibacteria bacterium]|nr:hypothetical protein [Candidatus Saccharibacteria bacterium]
MRATNKLRTKLSFFAAIAVLAVFLIQIPATNFINSLRDVTAFSTTYVQVSDWTGLQQEVAGAIGHTNIELENDISSTATLTIPLGADITLSGIYSLIATGNYPVVTVNGTLTLAGITVTRTGATANLSRGIVVSSSGVFVMESGMVSGHTVGNVRGAGVQVFGGSFTMNGGEISGNFANTAASGSNGGGGVHIDNGIFTMNGGAVQFNTSNRHGGGVFLTGDSTFSMDGGAIRNNQASIGAGVGTFTTATSIFNMNDGEIYDNLSTPTAGNAAALGGGVNIEFGIFNMNGGVIRDNTVNMGGVAQGGGGVFIQAGGTFNLYNGLIYNNHSLNVNGGGVRLHGAGTTFNMYGGEVRYNHTLGNSGGGVALQAGTTFNLHDGVIGNNAAATNGGGVIVEGGAQFVMEDGMVVGNTSNGTAVANGGGGVFMTAAASNFTMNGGYISGNNAQRGGGIRIASGTFVMNSGTIDGNHAVYDGGGIFAPHPANYRVPLISTDYPNITVGEDAIFDGNSARFAIMPHESATAIARIESTETSIFWHLLNNFDINFAPTSHNTLVTFEPGTNGNLVGGTPDVVMSVPYGTTLTAADVPNVIANAGWTHSGWLLGSPVGFLVVDSVVFIAQYEQIIDPEIPLPPDTGHEAVSIPGMMTSQIVTVLILGIVVVSAIAIRVRVRAKSR